MGLFDTITLLQQKSRAERQKVALGSAFIITFLIVVVWGTISFVPFNTGGISSEVVSNREEEKKVSAPSPFGTLSESISQMGASVSAVLENFNIVSPVEYRRGQ